MFRKIHFLYSSSLTPVIVLAHSVFQLVRFWFGGFFQHHCAGHREEDHPEAFAVSVCVGRFEASHVPDLHAPESDIGERAYHADYACRVEGEIVFAGQKIGYKFHERNM